MNKVRKMLTAAGGPIRLRFTPKQIAYFRSQGLPLGMNNSGGLRLRTEGAQAQLYQELEKKRKEEEVKSRMERRPVLKRKATTAEKIKGKRDEYKLESRVVGMSGVDPVGEFVLAGVGLNGVGALAKTGLWNVAKYAPRTLLGNWGRGYFVSNTFKNSFNGNVPKLVLSPLIRTKVGDVEIDNPNLLYHLDRGDGAGAFSNQGAYVEDGVLFPGAAKKEGQLGYSWWNAGKPYAISVKGQPMTRMMTATKDTPGMLQVRSQNYPIGQWTGSKGFVLPSEYVNPKGVNVSENLYTWKPGYGYKKIVQEPSTSLKFFERPTLSNAQELAGATKWERNFKPKWHVANYPGYLLKGLMKGSLLEKQLSKNGTININLLNAYFNKASQIEKEVANKVLSEKFAGLKTIDYNLFKKAVLDELIGKYNRVPLTKYEDYGIERLGVDVSNTFNLIKEIPALSDRFFVTKSNAGFPMIISREYPFKEFTPKEVREAFPHLIPSPPKLNTFTFESPRIQIGNNKHYDATTLGHSRTYTLPDEPNILYVMESLSDWGQSHVKMMPSVLAHQIAIEKALKSGNTNAFHSFTNRFSSLLADKLTKYERMALENINKEIESGLPSGFLTIEDLWNKKYEILKKAGNRSNIGVLGLHLHDNYLQRQLQENLRYAAENGLTKMRYPTSETAAKIEGYLKVNHTLLNELSNLQIKLGELFENGEISWEEYDKMIDAINKLKKELFGKEYDPKHQTILKKYSDFPKLFLKLFKGLNVRTITDAKGNTWYEVDVPKGYLSREWQFKQGGKINILEFLKNGGQIRKMQTAAGGPLQLTPEELKYLEWSKMTPKLKREYRTNRAKSHLLSGPNIINFWEAFQTYIGNRDPENPHLQTGDVPNPGMRNPRQAINIVKKTPSIILSYKKVVPRFIKKVKEFNGANKILRTISAASKLISPTYTKTLAKSPELVDLIPLWGFKNFNTKLLQNFLKVWETEAAKGPYSLKGLLQYDNSPDKIGNLSKHFEEARKLQRGIDLGGRYGRLVSRKYQQMYDLITDPTLKHIADTSPLYIPELFLLLKNFGGASEGFLKELIKRSNSYRRYMTKPGTAEDFKTFKGSGLIKGEGSQINVEGKMRSDFNGEYGSYPGYYEGLPNLKGDVSTWWDQRIPLGVDVKLGIWTENSTIVKLRLKGHNYDPNSGSSAIELEFWKNYTAPKKFIDWPTHQVFFGTKGSQLLNFNVTTEMPKNFIFGKGYKQGGKMNILEFLKNGGQIRKMLTASGGPINYKRWDDAKITSYTIPFIKEKAIKLTNAGRATGAVLSTNLLDSLADNAIRAGVPIRTAIGISTKESTLGNPTDDKSAWNISSKIRKLFNGVYPGTVQHINNGTNLVNGINLINYHKGNIDHEMFNGAQGKSIIQEGLEFYKTHPSKYNPGLKGYQKAVDNRGKEVMNSPEVLKWYREWERSKAQIFRPEPYKINTNIQNTTQEFISRNKQGGKMNILELFKNGGQVRKMQTAAGGPITRYETLPNIEVIGYRPIELKTYKPLHKDYPFTGHSSLDIPIDEDTAYTQGGYLPYGISVDKTSNSKDYNLITNNCADATLGALNYIFGTKEKPLLFTTPGDVRDYAINKLHGKVTRDKDRIDTILIPRNKNNAKKISKKALEWAKNKDKNTVYEFEYKQGGKMNILEFLKNGSGIHIKKKNRGKFTSYCGGKVTDECIRKAKASGNPTLIKRATFADNARHFKHLEGGIITPLISLGTSLWLMGSLNKLNQNELNAFNKKWDAKLNSYSNYLMSQAPSYSDYAAQMKAYNPDTNWNSNILQGQYNLRMKLKFDLMAESLLKGDRDEALLDLLAAQTTRLNNISENFLNAANDMMHVATKALNKNGVPTSASKTTAPSINTPTWNTTTKNYLFNEPNPISIPTWNTSLKQFDFRPSTLALKSMLYSNDPNSFFGLK